MKTIIFVGAPGFEKVTLPILDFYKYKGVEIAVFDAETDKDDRIIDLL